ncbi:MAG TPA: hypothetical protein VF646_09255, partial [Cytophagales bacterium]
MKKPFFLFVLSFLLALPWVPARAQSVTWATKTNPSGLQSAVVASEGNYSYVLSSFSGTVTAAGKTYTSFGGWDLLLTCYFDDGKVRWVSRIGGAGNEHIGDVTLSVDEWMVYVTGSFQGVVTFEDDKGNAVLPLASAGQS